MTDEQIIKALECCTYAKGEMCNECPYVLGVYSCDNEQLHKDALNLINRLRAKNKALQMDNEQLQSDIVNANMNLEHMTAEVERLNVELSARMELEKIVKAEFTLLSAYFQVKSARAEAIKEFAERLKNASGSAVAVQDGRELYETKSYTINAMKLDNLVKEMVGESDV